MSAEPRFTRAQLEAMVDLLTSHEDDATVTVSSNGLEAWVTHLPDGDRLSLINLPDRLEAWGYIGHAVGSAT